MLISDEEFILRIFFATSYQVSDFFRFCLKFLGKRTKVKDVKGKDYLHSHGAIWQWDPKPEECLEGFRKSAPLLWSLLCLQLPDWAD